MKKICIILSTHYSAFMGGAQFQAKCILEGLIPTKKYEIHYLTRRVDPDFKPDGYKIHQISSGKKVHPISLYTDVFHLYKILKKIAPDIIYQRVAGPYTGISAYYAKKHSHCKMIWHVAHNTDVTPDENVVTTNFFLKHLHKKFVEFGIKNTNYIVTQTIEQRELLRQYYARSSDKIIANFHPIPADNFKKDGLITVAWVANFKPWKQPEIFIQLAKNLDHLKNVRFIMVGALQGGDREWRVKLLSDMNALHNLEYAGEKSQNDVNIMLSQAHLFVNTSLHEGFANTFIQAWMRKVPVISLNVNPDNVFCDAEIGFHSKTFEKLQKDVEHLILNSERRRDMGKKARIHAMKHHSFDNVELLMELIDR